jgi:hypothetical protein
MSSLNKVSKNIRSDINGNVNEAVIEILEGRTWNGEKPARVALSLIDRGLESHELDLEEALEVKNRISDAFLTGGLHELVEDLDAEIEADLSDLSDDDDRMAFAAHIGERRARMWDACDNCHELAVEAHVEDGEVTIVRNSDEEPEEKRRSSEEGPSEHLFSPFLEIGQWEILESEENEEKSRPIGEGPSEHPFLSLLESGQWEILDSEELAFIQNGQGSSRPHNLLEKITLSCSSIQVAEEKIAEFSEELQPPESSRSKGRNVIRQGIGTASSKGEVKSDTYLRNTLNNPEVN